MRRARFSSSPCRKARWRRSEKKSKFLARRPLQCPATIGRCLPYGPIAQLDRVLDYESRGRGFESSSVRHLAPLNISDRFNLWVMCHAACAALKFVRGFLAVAETGGSWARAYRLYVWVGVPLCAARFPFLDWWTGDGCVGTKYAAIPFERLENRLTRLAFIEPLTSVRGHDFRFRMPARGAGQGGVQSYFCVFCRHSAYPVSVRNPARTGSRTASV